MLILTYARDVRLPFPHVAMVTPYARHRPRAEALWLDSGGFAWLKGRRPPAADALCKLCEELGAEVCFAPDYPPRPSEDVYTYIALELKGLAEAAGAPCDLAPVVHMHPSRAAFSAALRLAARLAERRGTRLGLGGAVHVLKRHMYGAVADALSRALEAHGRVHLFGAGSPTTIRSLGLPRRGVTADWAGWTFKAAVGKVALPWGGERAVAGRPRGRRATREELEALWRWLASRGYGPPPPEEFIRRLAEDFKTRAAVNAYVALALAGSI